MLNKTKTQSAHSVKKLAAACFIRTLLACVTAFIIYASFTIIAVGAFTKQIGYTVVYSDDSQGYREIYTHYYSDGEDTEFSKYENDEHYSKTPIRSTISNSGNAIVRWFSQGVSFIVWAAMIYSVFWQAGDYNANRSELGKEKCDNFMGLKAGVLCQAPFWCAYVILLLSYLFNFMPNFARIYKILFYYLFAFQDTFIPSCGDGFVFSAGGMAVVFAATFILPLWCHISYKAGLKHLLLKEKIIYKK